MQALEFKFSVAREAQNHAGGIGIVGGKLGENLSLGIEQNHCTLLVAEVGVGFAGKHRVAFQPQFLSMFNFSIPIGAFNQAHQQPAVGLAGQAN